METILAGLAGTAASNATSEWHANKQMQRETRLMGIQNQMNQSNALSAYQNQVQGARMAGLSPALLNGQTPQVAAPVSKGSVSQAENVEIDPATLLLQAQRENIDADTDKKKAETAKIEGVDTKNVAADTDLKVAQKLFTGANQDKVEQESVNMRNINEAFAAENDMLADAGRVMAEKWQSTPWYNALGPDTKATIDSIADGSLPLSVGGLKALEGVIDAQKNLSDSDRALVKNAFDNVITDAMVKDKKVMEALTKLPDTDKRKAEAQIKDLVASARHHNIQSRWQEKEFKSKEFNDPNWTWENFWAHPSLKNFGIWLQASYSDKLNSLRETAQSAAAHAAGGAALGKFGGSAVGSSMQRSSSQGSSGSRWDYHGNPHQVPNIYGHDGSILRQGYTENWHNYQGSSSENEGVQQMRYR